MAITEALRLVIDADARGAVRGIEQVGRTADRELGRSEQKLDRWGSRLSSVGAGLVSFGAVAAFGLAQAAQSAAQLEQAVGGTEAVFKESSNVIDEYAQNAAQKVGLSERAFRDLSTVVGAQLKNMGFSVDEAAGKSIELVEIGADLAATFGGTTQEAVEALGAAFRGEADPAERFGLRLNQTAVNAKAVELGLAESTSAVDANAKAQATLALVLEQSADAQGQFAREADTAAGQQQRLAAQFEDLKAEIGQGAIPVMQTLVGVASDVAGGFSSANDATGGFLGKAATIATVASLGVGGLSLLVGQAIKMRENFSTAITAVSGMTDRLGGLKAAAGLAAGIAGIAGIAVAIDQMEDAADSRAIDELTTKFLATGDASQILDGALGNNYQSFKNGIRAFAEFATTNEVAARRLIEQAEAAGYSEDRIDALRSILATASAANEQASADAESNANAVEGQGDAYNDTAGDIDDATSALQKYAEELRAQFDPLFGMISAQQGLRDAQVGVTEAQNALNEALAGGDASEIAEAQRAYDDALTNSSQALIDAQSAQAALNDAVARGDVSLEDAQESLIRWATNAGFTGEQALIMAAQLGTATGAAQTLDAQNPKVDISAIDAATPAIHGVGQALRDVDGDSAKVYINYVYRSYGDIPGAAAELRDPARRATGGPVSAGRLYEVAEQGRAELLQMGSRTYLIPGSDGTVVPSSAWGGAGVGAGGTNVTYQLTFNGPTNDQQVVEAIKRYERSNGPGWRG